MPGSDYSFRAAQAVNGSHYLLGGHRHRLRVNCGMYQGAKTLRRRNWMLFPAVPELYAEVEIGVQTAGLLFMVEHLQQLSRRSSL